MHADFVPLDAAGGTSSQSQPLPYDRKAMISLPRRALLVGSGAAAATSAVPAFAQAAAMSPVRMIKANGINLAVYEAGSGSAIVLLHGFSGLALMHPLHSASVTYNEGELGGPYGGRGRTEAGRPEA